MPKRSSKRKQPADANQLARAIVDEAMAADEEKAVAQILTPDGKNAAAVVLGRRGGLKGGKARADKLTAEQRTEIARKAAQARWNSTD